MSNMLSNLISTSSVSQSADGGLLLVANPGNPSDILYRSVVLLFHRSPHVVLGLQLNRELYQANLESIMEGLGFDFTLLRGDPQAQSVYFGGSINSNRLHFVHSLDWSGMNTHRLNNELGVTSDVSILSALSAGEGPIQYRACAGTWRWDIDTLQQQVFNLGPTAEKQTHLWEMAPVAADTVFTHAGENQWLQALDQSIQGQASAWMN